MQHYNVLLDDYQDQEDLFYSTRNELYLSNGWLVVRSYEEFTANISGYLRRGAFPRLVSVSSTISTLHISGRENGVECFTEKTGNDCLSWLQEFAARNSLDMPTVLVHSQSEV
jgi:hypothetical protein